jgi:hypothetical protein
LVPRYELRADGDTRGSLDFVAREHPNLDARGAQHLDRLLHQRLQFVLHTGQSDQVEIRLKRVTKISIEFD